MNDWTSLFRSLTGDALDTVDTLKSVDSVSAAHSVTNVESVNSVQSVNVSKKKERGAAFHSSTDDNGDADTAVVTDVTIVNVSNEKEEEVAISPPAAVSPFRSLTVDTLDSIDTVSTTNVYDVETSTPGRYGVNSVQSVNVSNGEEEAAISPLVASLAALERRRPDHIEAADWQHAVEDGRRFLALWGEQAERLGWTEADIFGLPPVPSNPHPSWQRLARVDQLGLVWLTHGRPVTSISAESATIATPRGGSVVFYRPRARREAQIHQPASSH